MYVPDKRTRWLVATAAVKTLGRAWVETAIVHLETVARVEARDHTDQPVTQVGDGDDDGDGVDRGQGGGWVWDCRHARVRVRVCARACVCVCVCVCVYIHYVCVYPLKRYPPPQGGDPMTVELATQTGALLETRVQIIPFNLINLKSALIVWICCFSWMDLNF